MSVRSQLCSTTIRSESRVDSTTQTGRSHIKVTNELYTLGIEVQEGYDTRRGNLINVEWARGICKIQLCQAFVSVWWLLLNIFWLSTFKIYSYLVRYALSADHSQLQTSVVPYSLLYASGWWGSGSLRTNNGLNTKHGQVSKSNFTRTNQYSWRMYVRGMYRRMLQPSKN